MFFSKSTPTAPQTKETIESLWRLEKLILDSLDFKEVVQKIVDSVLLELGYLKLGYKIVVLTLIDEKTQTLRRISISQTEEARKALEVTPVPFNEINIPLSADKNILIKAIQEKVPFTTHDWVDILVPSYTPEDARRVQQIVGIKTSMIYPVTFRNEAIGALIFSMVKDEIEVSEAERDLIRSFTDVVGLAVQNAELYSSLATTSEELKQANEKLKELDRVKDEFVSLASHELRTPMTVIKSYIWLLLEGKAGELVEKQKDYLNRTYDSTNRLIDMVNDMLNISRIESGRFTIESKPMDLVALEQEVVAEMQARAAEQGLHLSLNTPSQPLPQVNADADRIKQVLINLIGNSLKFTPRDGSITVLISQNDGQLVTSVKDTGMGIRPEDMQKLFKKFNMLGGSYLTKQSGQGSGLGLYLSKSLVELHHGRIWVESEGAGRGSTFTFTLPVVGAVTSTT
jgi:signal transduction histidine kinase